MHIISVGNSIRYFIVIFVFCGLCGCRSISYNCDDDLANVDNAIKSAERYIASPGFNVDFTKAELLDSSPNFKRNDLVMIKISIDVNHRDNIKLKYLVKKPEKIKKTWLNLRGYLYNFVLMDEKGARRLFGSGCNQENSQDNTRRFCGGGFRRGNAEDNISMYSDISLRINELIKKSSSFINGNENGIDIKYRPNLSEHVEKYLKRRIGDKITPDKLLLTSIEMKKTGEIILSYCIKPSIFRYSKREIWFYEMFVIIDKNGNCKIGEYAEVDYRSIDQDIPMKEVSEGEIMDIKESVLRYAFKISDHKKAKLRFIRGKVDQEFFKRFTDLAVPVRDPNIKYKNYTNGYMEFKASDGYVFKEYVPVSGGDAAFYWLNIVPFDNNCVFVEVTETYGKKSETMRTYTLEKNAGKWTVVHKTGLVRVTGL